MLTKIRLSLASLLLASGWVSAADLGRLTLLSGVGEPLRAEIEIHSVRQGEVTALRARIPPPEVFWRAKLEPPRVLDSLRAGVEPRPGHRYVVALRSNGPIEEPFLQILVELDSPSGTVLREYPFLLEERPEGSLRATPSPVLPRAEASPERPRRAPQTDPGTSLPGAAFARDGDYVVKPGDTLAAIARAIAPHGASVQQTMVALFRANEQAFVARDMNRLPAGAVLAIPPGEAVTAIGQPEALQVIRASLEGERAERNGVPDPGGTSSQRVGPGLNPGDRGVRANAPPVGRDHLRLTSPVARKLGDPAADPAAADDTAALQRALVEAQQRIALLEKSLNDIKELLGRQGGRSGPPERRERESMEALTQGVVSTASAEQRLFDHGRRQPRRFPGEYGGWLLAFLALGYLLWIVMPLKTARAWREQRRRREARLWGPAGAASATVTVGVARPLRRSRAR